MLSRKKRARTLILSGIVVVSLVLGGGILIRGAVDETSITAISEAKKKDNVQVHKIIENMSLEEKVGQLFVTDAYGENATEVSEADAARNMQRYGVRTPAEVVSKYHLGGVIYFSETNNTNSPTQVAALSNGLQEVATNTGSEVPLLISTDQEGGTVTRIGPPVTSWPGSAALAATRDPKAANTAARISGEELRAMGVNQNYAPDADVNVNASNPVIGVRSFGEDPRLVSEFTAAQVKGYQDENVVATVKHFPGHGDTDTDSHYGSPEITHTKEQWSQLDRPPFAAAVEANVDMIMSAHLVVPALDPTAEVATLSQPILTGYLREGLAFDGVIITDSLRMDGIVKKYPDAAVPPVLALQAGADQLLLPDDMDAAFNSVLSALRDGRISEKRVNASLKRILDLKRKRGLFRQAQVAVDAVDSVVGTAKHLADATKITDRSTTVVKNDAGALPLTSPGSVLVTGWGETTTQAIAAEFDKRGSPTSVLATGANPTGKQIAEAEAAARGVDTVIVSTNKPWLADNASQQELVNHLLSTGKKVIAVGTNDPYDIAYFTQVPAFIATYSYTSVALESLVRVLLGEVKPTGKLPVTIPAASGATALYSLGHGLNY